MIHEHTLPLWTTIKEKPCFIWGQKAKNRFHPQAHKTGKWFL